MDMFLVMSSICMTMKEIGRCITLFETK
jgi:hypothetical protein